MRQLGKVTDWVGGNKGKLGRKMDPNLRGREGAQPGVWKEGQKEKMRGR
jgi:hypothetical protein